jgi:hypothetical protein
MFTSFSTREEIFLTIYDAELDRFIRSLIARLKRVRSKDTVGAISRAWVEVALKHESLLDLLPQLSTSMERNSSVEQIVHFKRLAYERFGGLVQALERAYPKLRADQWATVPQCAVAMMAGLWPLANPGENVLQALAHPELNRSPWKCGRLMVSGLSALIQGTLQAEG